MASQRVDSGTGPWRPYSVGRSLLAHGWLPVLLQALLAEHQAGARQAQHGHLTHEAAATVPDLSRSDHRQKCPIFHDPICLCAIFVSFLMPANGPVPASGVVRSARIRGADHQPRPPRSLAFFDARAPPRLP
jgi:hypothetical protein